MRTIRRWAASVALVPFILVFLSDSTTSNGQSDSQPAADSYLQPIAPGDIPATVTTYYSLSNYLDNGGSLGPPVPFLQDTNATVYLLDANQMIVLVDDTGGTITNDETALDALASLLQPQDAFSARALGGSTAMDSEDINPNDYTNSADGGDSGSNTYSPSVMTYPTNILWIYVPTNSLAVSNEFSVVMENTVDSAEYDVLTSTNVGLPLSQWAVEQSVFGATGTSNTPVAITVNARPNLFVYARFGGSSDGSGIPDWWEQQYGVTNPYTMDPSQDGWTYLQDYQNLFAPGSWQTPPTPQGLTAQYNSAGGTANISWLPSPGPVQSYTVQKWDLQTETSTNLNFSAGTTGFLDAVPDTPFQPDESGPSIYITYSIQAHYIGGDSPWSAPVPLENSYGADVNSLRSGVSAQMVVGQPNSVYLAVNALPPEITLLRVTRMDTWAESYQDSSYDVSNDIPVSALVNGVYPLSTNITSTPVDGYGEADYDWWLQALDANGSPSAPVHLGANSGLTQAPAFRSLAQPSDAWDASGTIPLYFYDGRQQMKQNLDFLLRVATVAPFNYLSVPTNSDGANWGHISCPSNYVYAGLYQPYDLDSWQDEGLFDGFRPFEENYLFHNFVLTLSDLDANGELTTGAEDGWYPWDYWPYDKDPSSSIPAPLLQYPVEYEFPVPTNSAPIAAILDAASDAKWTYFFPLDTQDAQFGLDAIGVTSVSNQYYMTNNDLNYFGLPYVSALFATNNSGVLLLSSNGNIPAVGGFAYAQAAQPQLQTVDYYFAEPNTHWYQQEPQNLIPGNAGFSPTNTTQLLCASFGQPFQIAGYAKQQLNNSVYSGVYAYLGQYFEYARIIDTNGISTNSAGIISPYGTFLPTNIGPVELITMTNWDDYSGQRGTAMVQVISLNVDANHDGIMDTSFGGPDSTSLANPLVFWVNNDFDRTNWDNGDQTVYEDSVEAKLRPGFQAWLLRWYQQVDGDYRDANNNRVIPTMRDLEDFSRLWIGGITSNFLANLPPGSTVTLDWKDVGSPNTNNPTIDFFQAADPDGGTGYLTNMNTAMIQTNSSLCGFVGRLGPGDQIQLNNSNYFANGWAGNHLIWCGVAGGTGELTLTIRLGGTNAIAQSSVYIQLEDIKQMYERWTVGEDPDQPPATSAYLAQDDVVQPFQYGAPTAANTPYILFVPGWNLTSYMKDRFAETAFKRIYWLGYQGRFGSFRWPTTFGFTGSLLQLVSDSANFDRSEIRAWQSAAGLLNTLTQLHAIYGTNLFLYSVSHGNVVASEALRLAGTDQLVNTYLASQAAVTAHTYDSTVPNYSFIDPPYRLSAVTPNIYGNWFAGNLGGAAGRIINFFNTNDYALARSRWQTDQLLKPDQGVPESDGTWTYGYNGSPSDPAPWNNFYKYYVNNGTTNTVSFDIVGVLTNRYEVMAFAAESWTTALGATPQGAIPGVLTNISLNVDLSQIWPADTIHPATPFDEHFYHSGQFRGAYWQQENYWHALLSEQNGLGFLNP